MWSVPADQRSRGRDGQDRARSLSQTRSTAVAGSTLSAAATDDGSIGVLNAIVTGVGQTAVGRDGRRERRLGQRDDRLGRGGDGGGRLTGAEDADTEDESQAECEADPGQGRASQQCADAGRDEESGTASSAMAA